METGEDGREDFKEERRMAELWLIGGTVVWFAVCYGGNGPGACGSRGILGMASIHLAGG